MIVELDFKKAAYDTPRKGGRYLVMNADGVINVATWSGHEFVGWDIIENYPLIGIEYWADTEEVEVSE